MHSALRLPSIEVEVEAEVEAEEDEVEEEEADGLDLQKMDHKTSQNHEQSELSVLSHGIRTYNLILPLLG